MNRIAAFKGRSTAVGLNVESAYDSAIIHKMMSIDKTKIPSRL